MRYREFKDPFINKQPPSDFVRELLLPVHSECPAGWNTRSPKDDEILAMSISLRADFPDDEGVLLTAYEDFRCFMRCVGISEDASGMPIVTVVNSELCPEEYTVLVEREKVEISASDTEGVRRAIIYIEDEMKRRGGAFLPLGEIHRRPFVKKRISRCFFAPPSHASNEGLENELASDIDYYPEEYLNRLAHDGVNGLWLGASLRDILPSYIITEYGADSERRLNKLRSVVKRCKRYGIGVYLFSVEPASGYDNPTFEKYTEYHGQKGWGDYHLFCPSTEGCEQYIKESMTRLFKEVPDLAGFMGITTGECLSGCGSAVELTCPRCKKKYGTLAKTLAATERMISDAIHEVSPKADFISWTYSQRAWKREDVVEACEQRDVSVIHMQNFEDCGIAMQLGKERLALDYWLSYAGPGELIRDTLKVNKRRGIRTFAKIQACSSHEISSVPYIPVPGILYDKYKVMKNEGIDGAVMCWYFGNYPCMMNKAACEASFEPFFDKKEDFLRHVAGVYWGADAPVAARAYESFERGYINYPVSQSFEWFGPMQDSPVAPLHLEVVDLPMPSTWLLSDMVGGDRIGECLTDGHTIEEAVELSELMLREWSSGADIFKRLESFDRYERSEQKLVSEAIEILLKSGYNVLRFYELRRLLGIGKRNASEILTKLQDIVTEEIENSRSLISLCSLDSRLGYHSEAHGYKFFVEKLEWRINELCELLKTEFPKVKERIENGEVPLAFYVGEGANRVIRLCEKANETPFLPADKSVHGTTKEETAGNAAQDFENTEFNVYESKTTVRAWEREGRVYLEFTLTDGADDTLEVRPEYRLLHPSAPFELREGELFMPDRNNFSFFGKRAESRRKAFSCEYECAQGGTVKYIISFERAAVDTECGEPFRLAVTRFGKHPEVLCYPDRMFNKLIQGAYSPDSYAIFISE